MPSADVPSRPQLSFEAFVAHVLANAEPLSQNTDAGSADLGFGWIYYAMVRNYRPEHVVAIGSRRGFMPFCAARAVLDNGTGTVIFIDPSYVGYGPPGWSGAGSWSDPIDVAARVEAHGLTGRIEHIRLESADAFPIVRDRVGPPRPGVIIVDGAHTYEQTLQDFELYSTLFSEGVVLFHDAISQDTGVPRALRELQERGIPLVTLRCDAGLAIAEIPPWTRADCSWGYLNHGAGRARAVAEHVRPLLRAGDRVMDAYCGASPLAPLLGDARIFGFDRDASCIARLRRDHARQEWRVVDERHLPFARGLPDAVDVLVGLGVSHGHAWWDPQEALNNFRYLLGRYAPRACLFESAADYHGAGILDDLASNLSRLGYAHRRHAMLTDLPAYPRRMLLVATR